MPISVKPSTTDLVIARFIANNTNPPAEKLCQAITWGADEHVLFVLAAGWWLWCRQRSAGERLASNHVLLATAVTAVVPHLFKAVFNQERPDRLTLKGHLNGVPVSGNARDAFPSGHAIHIGALTSAATRLPPRQRAAVWAVGAGLVLTRIVLLAHWTSDVLAGLAIGAALERSLRWITGFDRSRSGRTSG